MYYLTALPERPEGYHHTLSTATDWEPWLHRVVPDSLHADVRSRLSSNLKHVLVGLEMKAALIVPHGTRGAGRPVLFESYFTVMIFEFCVGVFSLCEGLGAAFWLRNQRNDGATGPRISPIDWVAALVAEADATSQLGLRPKVLGVKAVRDRIHQDQVGLRAAIDWHAFGYEAAFVPAKEALGILFALNADAVPEHTNLS